MIHKKLAVLAFSSVFAIAGCNDSTTISDPVSIAGTTSPPGTPGSLGTPAPPGSSVSVLESSDSVIERFGTLTARNTAPDVEASSQADVVRAINNFSLDLHRTVVATAPTSGSVESGYSAAVALSLTYAGTAGNTQSALANMLGVDAINESVLHPAINALGLALNSRGNEDLVLHTANQVFVRPGLALQDDYLDIATGDYGAPVIEADFAGANEEVTRVINAWVAEQTDNFIPKIVDSFPSSTVFALLNTIFLDAAWQDEYEAVGLREFIALDGSTMSVESFSGRSQLPVLRTDDLLGLEIPYGGGEISMLILMPDSLETFEPTLNASAVENLVNSMTDTDVNFTVPNWEDEADLDLAELLAPLGFPENPWNFGRMIEGGASLEVLAKQRARIEVDENGTRAAAVTAVAGIESQPEFVSIDRPFVYLIRDRVTGLILFTGRVVSPG
ncbi:MAG: serpin family protein [Granulosicoccus sp.]